MLLRQELADHLAEEHGLAEAEATLAQSGARVILEPDLDRALADKLAEDDLPELWAGLHRLRQGDPDLRDRQLCDIQASIEEGVLQGRRWIPGPTRTVSGIRPAILRKVARAASRRWGVAVSERMAERCLEEYQGVRVGRILVPDGDSTKNLRELGRLWEGFLDQGLDRHSAVVALGGGVVGDLAGFAAASFLRGIPFVQVPTTVLSMVDASIGGKTGINLARGKNLVGAFHQPRGVFIDTATLASLPMRQRAAGAAEIIKAAAIRALDSGAVDLWPAFEAAADPDNFGPDGVHPSLEGHKLIVATVLEHLAARAG